MNANLNSVSFSDHMRRQIVSRPEDSKWHKTIEGEILTIRVHSRETGRRYAIVDSIVQPLAGPPLHTHREDEIFEILDGTMTFVSGGERFEAPAGTIVVAPAGVPHAWVNLSAKPVSMRTILMPGGTEDVFTRLDGLSISEMEKLVGEYGITIVGAPIAR
jgi:quercetin dioxygenase-like cupin family protein